MILRLLICAISLFTFNAAHAEAMTAKQIIEKSLENANGLTDITQSIKMVLIDKGGNESERQMQVKAMNDPQGNKYSMSIFTAPSREKGISLLSVLPKSGDGKQYLYLPSSRRVKRITSSNKASSFRGSEFTFEDLGNQSAEDYTFKTLKEEACGEQQCYVIERLPKNDESIYSKTHLWVDKTHFRPIKAEFYDTSNKLLKTMNTVNYRQLEGKYWSPEEVVMKNVQNGKSTKMVSVELKTNTGLKTSEFTELAMRNYR